MRKDIRHAKRQQQHTEEESNVTSTSVLFPPSCSTCIKLWREAEFKISALSVCYSAQSADPSRSIEFHIRIPSPAWSIHPTCENVVDAAMRLSLLAYFRRQHIPGSKKGDEAEAFIVWKSDEDGHSTTECTGTQFQPKQAKRTLHRLRPFDHSHPSIGTGILTPLKPCHHAPPCAHSCAASSSLSSIARAVKPVFLLIPSPRSTRIRSRASTVRSVWPRPSSTRPSSRTPHSPHRDEATHQRRTASPPACPRRRWLRPRVNCRRNSNAAPIGGAAAANPFSTSQFPALGSASTSLPANTMMPGAGGFQLPSQSGPTTVAASTPSLGNGFQLPSQSGPSSAAAPSASATPSLGNGFQLPSQSGSTDPCPTDPCPQGDRS
jgi:hypothetical protein